MKALIEMNEKEFEEYKDYIKNKDKYINPDTITIIDFLKIQNFECKKAVSNLGNSLDPMYIPCVYREYVSSDGKVEVKIWAKDN